MLVSLGAGVSLRSEMNIWPGLMYLWIWGLAIGSFSSHSTTFLLATVFESNRLRFPFRATLKINSSFGVGWGQWMGTLISDPSCSLREESLRLVWLLLLLVSPWEWPVLQHTWWDLVEWIRKWSCSPVTSVFFLYGVAYTRLVFSSLSSDNFWLESAAELQILQSSQPILKLHFKQIKTTKSVFKVYKVILLDSRHHSFDFKIQDLSF